jgi:alpha-tubulin suppressor-like RCC1 family protein
VVIGWYVLVTGGCEPRQLPLANSGGGGEAEIPLQITAVTAGTPINTLVVVVTAPDIPMPLVFNLAVVDGVATGTIRIPPGTARTISVTALDPVGNVTHEGAATIDVLPGPNPSLQLRLTPRAGDVPVTVTFGDFGVVVSPPALIIDASVSAQAQLTVTVTDANGVPLTAPAVGWATTQPAVARVTATGVVTGASDGIATIVATYEGVAAVSTVTVTGAAARTYTDLSTGSWHSCALTPAGGAFCWGDNMLGDLGDGTMVQSAHPAAVEGGLTFSSVSAGDFHTCALTPAGAAYCWGSNEFGQLGAASTEFQHLEPVAVIMPAGATFTRVSAGGLNNGDVAAGHTCALTPTGTAYCWGYNLDGELGNGETDNQPAPVPVAGGLAFTTVAVGGWHTCGLTASGSAWCWGRNDAGQLGEGTTTTQLTPVPVAGGLAFAEIAVGNRHTCGRTMTGIAWCWGDNRDGQLGDGTTTNRPTPVAVSGGLSITALSAGVYHTCGLTAGGQAYCWGAGGFGRLGDGTTTTRLAPVPVTGGLSFARLAAGSSHTCGLTPAGAAWCWGNDESGQLGDGTTTLYRPAPVAVVP